jgi:urease beta subunit
MQSHRITLSFHREMADSSREDITAAVRFESYPRTENPTPANLKDPA